MINIHFALLIAIFSGSIVFYFTLICTDISYMGDKLKGWLTLNAIPILLLVWMVLGIVGLKLDTKIVDKYPIVIVDNKPMFAVEEKRDNSKIITWENVYSYPYCLKEVVKEGDILVKTTTIEKNMGIYVTDTKYSIEKGSTQ